MTKKYLVYFDGAVHELKQFNSIKAIEKFISDMATEFGYDRDNIHSCIQIFEITKKIKYNTSITKTRKKIADFSYTDVNVKLEVLS